MIERLKHGRVTGVTRVAETGLTWQGQNDGKISRRIYFGLYPFDRG
jgi:hypothetical protein